LEGNKYLKNYLILSLYKIQGKKKRAGVSASPLGIDAENECLDILLY